MSSHAHAAPVAGPLWTPSFKVLVTLAVIGGLTTLWRFAVGLGAATNLSDGYPWGLWIAFDVVTGTALACGGYAIALMVYVLNQGRYHPLVRPAVLTSALGYSMAALAITIDVGRPWLIHRIPLNFLGGTGNLDSALLEVALCVMAYIVVLWIEVSPAFLEKWAKDGPPGLQRLALRVDPILEKALPFILAAGLLLPTMHQSSLGTVMLLAGAKLHGLWSTPFLPLLFLVSCLAMGYAMVILEAAFSSVAFRRKPETEMLATLARPVTYMIFLYLGLRLVDLLVRGRLSLLFRFDAMSLLFLVEMALFLWPAYMLLDREKCRRIGYLYRAAALIAVAGALYRFDTYLIAFQPGRNWAYLPAVPEVLITVGLISAEIAIYVALVKNFPILSGERAAHA